MTGFKFYRTFKQQKNLPIMNNIFLQYMSERMKQEHLAHKEPGPVITISREYGCYASKIAKLLVEKLNHAQKGHSSQNNSEWHYITKEILEEASQKLQTDPEKISHIFGATQKDFLHDLIESFSTKRYASDSNIKRTIKLVVQSYAEQGRVIIVGRAGCILAKHIPKSFHFKLTAPFEWRVERIMERFNLEPPNAKKQVLENDERRKNFMNFFKGNKPDCTLFDAVFNRSTMSDEEIVESVFKIVQLRKII